MSDVTMHFSPPLEFIIRQQGTFRRALEDMTGLWRRFVPIISAMERRWFESHGDGAWPELAPATVKQKAARGFTADPLRTDDRPESLYQTLIDPQKAARVEAHALIWETTVPYAGYHQDGGSIPGRPPQRQVIPDPLPLADRRLLEAATVSWINEAAAQAFRR